MKYFVFILLFTGSICGFSQEIQWKRGSFGTEKRKSSSLSAGDLDGDGDLDVAISNGRHWPDRNEVYFNWISTCQTI